MHAYQKRWRLLLAPWEHQNVKEGGGGAGGIFLRRKNEGMKKRDIDSVVRWDSLYPFWL